MVLKYKHYNIIKFKVITKTLLVFFGTSLTSILEKEREISGDKTTVG
jgi:hypothetical protein